MKKKIRWFAGLLMGLLLMGGICHIIWLMPVIYKWEGATRRTLEYFAAFGLVAFTLTTSVVCVLIAEWVSQDDDNDDNLELDDNE